MSQSRESHRHLRDPKVWGPTFWKTYDIIVQTYPREPNKKQRKAALDFFHSQKYLIPCTRCSKNYRRILRKYPPRVESRPALEEWFTLLKHKVAKHVAKQ
uniref:thiol oxidase n=1 Tax=viral metagenome TaxID=1070528 RepID=A0A6C0BNM6_9ZZZZ